MAVKGEFESITSFEDWYGNYRIDPRDGTLRYQGFAPCAGRRQNQYDTFKREMDARVANYWKYERIADAAIVKERADLPNVSSGEAAGFIRRIARSVVQHTPNITVTSKFDDDDVNGTIATWIAKSKVIGDDEYSNNMQQQLYATMIRASALGFDCVVPTLLQNSAGTWYIQYDNINYRDVFPEPGVQDIRRAPSVFIRRYLTRGEIWGLIKDQAVGWDIAALRTLLETTPARREHSDHQSKKHSYNPEAYEIITWYSNTGDPFLTWDAQTKMLLRIEKNKHPLKEHPVFFFVPEYDGQQPFGRSILSLIYGRQEFQDWFLNGAMKLWRLNIEPPIIGYGVVNAIPNLGPGKYTQIANPNAKVEAFEVNSSTLTMFSSITQSNAGNMAQIIGATDQQMAAQSGAPGSMRHTPQGVEAQQAMVDITTNNYQKALEAFFSRYCSYALTVYFQELKGVKSITPSADARKQLLNAGLPAEAFKPDGSIKANFSDLAVQYFVKTVPGSLTEMEDEKQIRLLNQMFVPLSQALGAIAQSGNQQALQNAVAAMEFIVSKQIELSGSSYNKELKDIFTTGHPTDQSSARAAQLEAALAGHQSELVRTVEITGSALSQLQEQQTLLADTLSRVVTHLGVQVGPSAALEPGSPVNSPAPTATPV